jgi:hypothetical protein
MGLLNWQYRRARVTVAAPVTPEAKAEGGFEEMPILDRSQGPPMALDQSPASQVTFLGEPELRARMSRSSDGLQLITHSDGRRSVNLQGRYSSVSAVVKVADGATRVQCFSNFDEMKSKLTKLPTTTSHAPY